VGPRYKELVKACTRGLVTKQLGSAQLGIPVVGGVATLTHNSKSGGTINYTVLRLNLNKRARNLATWKSYQTYDCQLVLCTRLRYAAVRVLFSRVVAWLKVAFSTFVTYH
jgi:hypothetical protein